LKGVGAKAATPARTATPALAATPAKAATPRLKTARNIKAHGTVKGFLQQPDRMEEPDEPDVRMHSISSAGSSLGKEVSSGDMSWESYNPMDTSLDEVPEECVIGGLGDADASINPYQVGI
jgi:hypothetical protein